MSIRLAAHWAVTVLATMTALVVAPLPFAGRWAGAAGTVAALAVLAIGYATTPEVRKPTGCTVAWLALTFLPCPCHKRGGRR